MEKPLVCFTCNRELGRAHLAYEVLLKENKTSKDILDMLGITKMCCRTCVLSSVDMFEDLSNIIYVPAGVEIRVANGMVQTDASPDGSHLKSGVVPRQQPICIRAL